MSWLPFVWMAVAAAATAGFGYGTVAFLISATGTGLGSNWLALTQAHGHLQLFGWAGLMVLGVGFFFLPRLRGAPLSNPWLLPWILGLMSAGLTLRALSQLITGSSSGVAGLALAASGVLEFAAATVAIALLVATARQGPPVQQRQGLIPVLPHLAYSFVSLWVALAANAVFCVGAAVDGIPLIPANVEAVTTLLGMDGFLVPVSVAVAARSFPLFLWLRVPSTSALRAGFWPFAVGVALRVVGSAAGWPPGMALGSVMEGLCLVAFAIVLQVVPIRRRAGARPSSDPHYVRAVEYLLVPAFLWLVVAGVLAVENGLALAGLPIPLESDAERHALGSGFITLLIFGMGQRMLPGFGGREIASRGLIWATVALGNGSALLRVLPSLGAGVGLLSAEAAAGWVSGALAVSGVLGLGGVLCFGVNLWMTLPVSQGRRSRRP